MLKVLSPCFKGPAGARGLLGNPGKPGAPVSIIYIHETLLLLIK